MSDTIFGEVDQDLDNLYEAITRQDRAELGMLSAPRIKEHLQKLRLQFSGAALDEQGYDSFIQSISRHLDQLEEYCRSFHNNKPKIAQKIALKFHASVRKQINALRQFNKKSK